MDVSGKDCAPEVLRNTVPYALETAAKGSHFKAHYKRYRFDFYKPDGYCKTPEKVLMKQEKRTKKNIMTYYALCLGDSIEIECKLSDWTFKKVLSSGQAMVIDQSVQEMSVGVTRVITGDIQRQGLTLRDGTLLI